MRALQLTREPAIVDPLIEQAARCYCAYHEGQAYNPMIVSAAAGRTFARIADQAAFQRRVRAIYAHGVAA